MRKLTTRIRRLLHPPAWVYFLFPLVFAALIWVFAAGRNDSAPAYVLYVLSAYCLAVSVIPLPRLAKRAKAAVMRRVNGTAFGKRYVEDAAFRGGTGLFAGMIFDFIYVAFRIAVGIRYSSLWFVSMAVYYLVLGGMRLSLFIAYRRRGSTDERKYYRRTARLLFLLNIPMGAMILQMVLTDSGYSYPGYVIYISAMYTFYTMIASVAALRRFRRLGSPVLSAAKAVNFVAAMMSVLGLQTAMIAQFSAESDGFRKMMNALTGGAVWSAVILTAAFMLRRSRRPKDEVSTVEQIAE